MVLRLLNHIVTNHKQTMVKHLGVLFFLIIVLMEARVNVFPCCKPDIEVSFFNDQIKATILCHRQKRY